MRDKCGWVPVIFSQMTKKELKINKKNSKNCKMDYSGTPLLRSPRGQKIGRNNEVIEVNEGFFTRKCIDVFAVRP